MSTLLAASIPLDTDGTLAANSDSKVATQKATKTYADTKGVVDGQQIFDAGHVLAADFDLRELKDSLGNVIVNWEGAQFSAQLTSAPGVIAADPYARQLIANDGSTVIVDWSDPIQVSFFSGSSLINATGFSGDGSQLVNVPVYSVIGTSTNDDADSGNVGEYVQTLKAIGSPVSLSNGTAANIINVSLSAGDWDVEGIASFTETTATVSARSAGISVTSATLPTDGSEGYCGVQSTLTSEINSIALTRKRISIATTTTIYIVGKASFSAGTCGGFGAINARRVR